MRDNLASDSSQTLTVLLSFPVPGPSTNPYTIMLTNSLSAQDDVVVKNFTWRAALLGNYDVFHVHWPEILVKGRTRPRKLARQALFVALLARLRLTRTPLVRTVHNLGQHEWVTQGERMLLWLADRWTTLRIAINPATMLPADQPHEVILHGHYRDWYAKYPTSAPVEGRVSYFGTIRRYKGASGLIRAFREIPEDGSAPLSLAIAGRLTSPDLEEPLRELASPDPRIELTLDFVSDAELVRRVSESELVVLPYLHMHNSGSALATLSLNRPLLLPDNDVNQLLSQEVGEGWIYTYTGDLSGRDILRAHAALTSDPPPAAPDLGAREWPASGRAHVKAYKRALALSDRRRAGTPGSSSTKQ